MLGGGHLKGSGWSQGSPSFGLEGQVPTAWAEARTEFWGCHSGQVCSSTEYFWELNREVQGAWGIVDWTENYKLSEKFSAQLHLSNLNLQH